MKSLKVADEDWFSEELSELRRNHSTVESLMFVLKYVFNFDRGCGGEALMR